MPMRMSMWIHSDLAKAREPPDDPLGAPPGWLRAAAAWAMAEEELIAMKS